MSKILKDIEFTFTGRRYGTEGDDNIDAIGFGGIIYAGGGNDDIKVGAVAAVVYTGDGTDWVTGGAAYLKVIDEHGYLDVKGLTAWSEIQKSGHGSLMFKGASAAVDIEHTGYEFGNIDYSGAAASNVITRKGNLSNVTFKGAGGYNKIWHETNSGNLKFDGAGINNVLTRTWFDKYKDSKGNIDFKGLGGNNEIRSRVESGDINFAGAGVKNVLERKGKLGDINMQGAGAYNQIVRTSQFNDAYNETRGNINYEGIGGYNKLSSDVAHGHITFKGAAGFNEITRTGQRNSRDDLLVEYMKAEDIVLVSANMINLRFEGSLEFNQVIALKSLREPNTYLFKTPGWLDTNFLAPDYGRRDYTFNKVKVYNDPKTGKLKYDSELWRIKPDNEGRYDSNLNAVNRCWNDLEKQDIAESHQFTKISADSNYQLSNLKVEHQHLKYQNIEQHGTANKLHVEDEWVTYGEGLVVDADDITLGDARMTGSLVPRDGIAVKAVKSKLKPNTYVYGIYQGNKKSTRVVECELDNHPETGVLRYRLTSWCKDKVDDTKNLANAELSKAGGFHRTYPKEFLLDDVNYQINNTQTRQDLVDKVTTDAKQDLFTRDDSKIESSGDINFTGVGGGNIIKSDVVHGNVNFNGGGVANIITHESAYGDTNFIGGGGGNIIKKKGRKGNLTFNGGGLANVLLHQGEEGKMDVNAVGGLNVLIRIGDGEYNAYLAALGNISIHKGQGNSRVTMLGGLNTHTQIGSSRRNKALWRALGGFNVMTQIGGGNIAAILAGGANVLTKIGEDDLNSTLLGGANIITHISDDESQSDTSVIALGGLNILTKKGRGNVLGVMGGGANVLTHIGKGNTLGVMLGGANILTKVGNGDLSGIMLGIGNVLTHVGDGRTLGVMGAAGNIFIKVGNGTSIAAMVGGGNIFTHVGEGDAWALMGGLGNVYTKVGAGNALALMIAKGNVFTHVGDGMSVALMLAKGNIATKVGNGMTLAAMVGGANIFTHVGNGETFAAMVGKANILTKVGSELTVGLMLGKANIYTHVGDGTSIGLFAGEANIMTKVGDGTTLAAMFGKANIMTHVGDSLTGVLALGEANVVTKVGNGFTGVIAAAKGNLVTHVGNATTAAVLGGRGNLLTKVGDGTTVSLLISDVGNIMTHVGNGATVGFAKGKANIITKVGDGLGINAAWGNANIFTHVGDGDRYNFAKGDVNLITKVGNGQEISVVQGKANIITHVGNGDNYTGAWGTANIVTQVGDGRQVTLAKGDANIVTMVGQGDSYGALWGKANISTKVGDGTQVIVAKGQANVTTTVGDGLGVTATYGDTNINTKVGNGVSVNVAWGKYNVNTKVGDGLNVSVMKGKANANIHVGDGLSINASYAQNNVIIKIGNGDTYSFSVASSNTESNKLASLFGNIKQSLLGLGGSQAINYLVQGDDATTSGSRRGKGAINLTGKTSIDGFKMKEIDEVGSDIGDKLTGSITDVETPNLDNVDPDESGFSAPNLIMNGEFKHGFKFYEEGWHFAHTEVEIAAISLYGKKDYDEPIKDPADIDTNNDGEGATDYYPSIVPEYTPKYEPDIAMYQDINGLMQDDVITLSFDYEQRYGTSTENKLRVIWNGEEVFTSSSDDKSITWQQQTLKLTANAENNRLIFKITGSGGSKGNDYKLRNIVAKSISANINKHISKSDAAKNALTDKDNANVNRQKLADEKQRQLDAISTTQTELESTDQAALEKNGHAERDAVRGEADSVTQNLVSMGQGFDSLDVHAQSQDPSGQQWRDQYAGGILDGVQERLDDAKLTSSTQLKNVQSNIRTNSQAVKEAIAKSEAAITQSEKHRQGAEQDIVKAKADATKRSADAVGKESDAERAREKALTTTREAELRGYAETEIANNKADKAQNDAKSFQQKNRDKPNRRGASGSGLSEKEAYVEDAGETHSHIDNTPITQGDGRFSDKLTEDEKGLLDEAQQAVNRLSINAGIRQKSGISLPSSTPSHKGQDSVINQVPSLHSGNLQRHEIGAIAVNLDGLGEKTENESPFFSVERKLGIIFSEDDTGFLLTSESDETLEKFIHMEDRDSQEQQKIIGDFIHAHYNDFDSMPEQLFLLNGKIVSLDGNKTRILSEKVSGNWQPVADSKLMTVDELTKAANVAQKVRGESYKTIIKTLADYYYQESNADSTPVDILQKLFTLRTQIDSYLLKHPDSDRNNALEQLRQQVDIRYKHASALIQDSQKMPSDSSFSRLYDQLSNANLKSNKHIYLDENGNFVTKGKDNLQGQDKLLSGKNAIERIKSSVEKEYGVEIAHQVFSQFTDNELARNGRGIDLSGLKKIHQAIEQKISPIGATLYIWKPSKHSSLGHAALQIGSGRLQLDSEGVQDNHNANYVSWWPLGRKSPTQPFNVSTEDNPDLRLRWYDLSQPARREMGLMTLESDIGSEEKTDFKLGKGEGESDKRLNQSHDNINPAKGFDKITPAYAAMLLKNDEMLSKSIIPYHVTQPFIEQWAELGCDPLEVSTKFAAAVKTWVQETYPPAVIDKRFANEIIRVKEFEEKQTDAFKTNGADEGAVFRINLEGLDAAAMQKEWKRISSDPDGRHQLLTKNCSSMVARVLKAGGADKLIGHNWKPIFGVWTPNELFKFSQKLQEAQLERIVRIAKFKEKVAIDNDGTPPNESRKLSPLTRYFNIQFYGKVNERRNITAQTQKDYNYLISDGVAEKATLQGDVGRLTGYYFNGKSTAGEAAGTDQKKVVLYLHGSGSPAEFQALRVAKHYNQQDIDMLAINLRGFGGSDGAPNEAGMYADAQTMYRYLVNDKGIDPKNIIIHGYSSGAPIAAKLAADVSAKGQRIAGLFLDRPMPSVSKAITAHGLFNLGGLVGQIAKKLNGQFSVEKNLQGLPKDVPIMLMTDSEGLGNEGEKMRIKLVADGYRVAGENTPYEHTDSHAFMNEYAKKVVSGLLEPEKQALGTTAQKPMKKTKVTDWDTVNVKPNVDGGDSRFDGQIIIQTEDDPIAAKAAAALAAKHYSNSVVVQLHADGNYSVVHGDPTQLSGKVRWQLVGHGREESENNHLRLSSYNADELAIKLVKFNTEFSTANKIKTTPDHISIVGCSLIGDDKQTGFARQFITALDQQGIHTEVSARVTEVAVDAEGHKYTKDSNGEWVAKQSQNKVVLGWDEKGEITTQFEQIRNGVTEGDIDITKVGDLADNKARGTIADNDEVFTAPKKRNLADQTPAVVMNSHLSYSGNIQANVGDGEFTSVNWGTSNLGIKVGTGGFKSLAFGDNNVMVHIGDGDSKHSVNIAGYQAFEGAQLFIGTRNVSFNLGRSNDLIVMLEKSIPTPPLVNPFDGAARIAGALESIARSGNDTDWLAAQDGQWTLAGAKKFAADMSGLDQTSSVDYKTLTDLDQQNKRSSRGLKSDLESTLNKKYNQWLGGNGNNAETGKVSRADKFRQLNEKVAFNFAVGGQGADIQVTAGNWNLMFGDNIQSIMDTNLGSLFGLMTQQFTATGMAKTTFTYRLNDLPRQLKNKLLGRLAGVSSDTTLGDIFGVDYTADGKIVSRSGVPVDGVAILKEMLTVVTGFGGEQLAVFTDPAKLLDNLQSSINMGKDGITSFAESHGLKKKAPEDQQDKSNVSVNGQSTSTAVSSAEKGKATGENDRAFGFNALNMPNLFATIFNKDKQKEMRELVENIKENLAADLLNMEKKTFDFLRNSGHLKGDGDMHVSLGNYNFNWGGDGSDLGAYLGDNNNFWGGRGADAFYATGISNIFTGGEGNDLGVLMGRENTMFGGKGDDIAVVAGRVNHVYLGEGNDQAFVFGEGGEIHTDAGNDYVVTTGNYNRIFSGSEQDFVVTIGNHNQIALEEGHDFAKIFGNYNSLNGGSGNDEIQLMGYHAVLNGNEGNDRLMAASISKFSKFDGGAGNDVIVLGGYQNNFKGGTGVDSFLINGNVIDCYVDDISQEDNIVLGGIDWSSLWFERSGYDLKISHIRTPQGAGDQAAFESIGSTTFTNYFDGNRAKVVIEMADKAASGEREYAALSDHSLDMQIQAMSAFRPEASASGFFDNVSGEAKQKIAVAWMDMVRGKGILA